MYKKTICLMTLVLLLSLGSTSLATTYYVSSSSGNDNHSGTSPSEAWQSLDKVNTVTFQPGDEILLEAGSVWENQQLYPKGSGTSAAPIIVDMYGTGAKPLINTNHVYHNTVGEVSVSAGLFLHNQEYWEINNLEITNYLEGVEGADLHGAYITAEETGICYDHIYLKNLDIHHVNAKLGRGAGRDKGKNNGGICIDVFGDTVAGTMFNDVLIEGCYIYECGGSGIKTWSDQHDWRCHDPTTYHTNIVMRNNVVDHIQGDGLVTAMTIGTLMEYNVVSWTHMRPSDPYVAIWPYEADDTIMQYNEAYLTQTTTDGQGYDIDDYTERTIMQYNYSHDNVGGFLLIIGIAAERGKCGTCDNNVVRYNISQDDGEEIMKFAGMSVHTDWYNNVIYHSGSPEAPPIKDVVRLSDSVDAHLYNNIFETWVDGVNFLQPDFGVKQGFDFRRNIIYGNSDYSKWISEYPDNQWGVDPKFVAPGTGGIGRDTCGGYMLGSTSPAIDYGLWSDDPILMALPSHPGPIGADHGDYDYFGNTLPYPSGTPDSGAHEYEGGGPQPPVADFVGNPTSGNAPLTVYFTDLSTGSPTSWDWTFGDGGTSQLQNPSHQYTVADTYTVSLTATNQYGQDTETKVDYITVTEGQPPVADFVGDPLSGPIPLDVAFTDLSTGSPTSWDWTFGDGGTSQLQNPSHQYTVADTYTVSLTATNQYGQDTETKVDYITATPGEAPVADFVGSPLSGPIPLDVAFTDLSTGSPTSWDWTFGDGGTSQLQNPSHQYTTADTYTVSLTATNEYGQDTETKVDYITATEGGGGDYFCTSLTIEAGTLVSGDHTDTHASDDVRIVIDSVKVTGKYSVYNIYTFETGLGSLSALSVTNESQYSAMNEYQYRYVDVWNYTSSSWDEIERIRIYNAGVDETTVTSVPSPADYISATGEVQIRMRHGLVYGSPWTLSVDHMKITAQP